MKDFSITYFYANTRVNLNSEAKQSLLVSFAKVTFRNIYQSIRRTTEVHTLLFPLSFFQIVAWPVGSVLHIYLGIHSI